MTPETGAALAGELEVALDDALWRVEGGDLDGERALELIDDYRERIAQEVEGQ